MLCLELLPSNKLKKKKKSRATKCLLSYFLSKLMINVLGSLEKGVVCTELVRRVSMHR